MKTFETGTVAPDKAEGDEHHLVAELRSLLANPSTAEFGRLAELVQRIHAEMTVTGGATPSGPDVSGGAAPAFLAKAGAQEDVHEVAHAAVEHHLHTCEQHFADDNLPF